MDGVEKKQYLSTKLVLYIKFNIEYILITCLFCIANTTIFTYKLG